MKISTAEFIEACVGLRAADRYANCIKAATPLPLQNFVVDLRERLRAVWRVLDGADPRTHAQKLATYHTWMALPLKPSYVRGPPHVLPRYLELELSRRFHVLRFYNGLLSSYSATLKHTLYADLKPRAKTSRASDFLRAFEGLRGCDTYTQAF